LGDGVQLKRVTLSRQELEQLPPEERDMLVYAGNVANEMSILHKLMAVAMIPADLSDAENKARLVQLSFVAQLLAGKTYEAYRMLEREFYGKKIAQRWDPEMSPVLRGQLDRLNAHFNRKDFPVKTIRQKHAFHIDPIDVGSVLKEANDPFEIYFAEAAGNCLYFGPSVVANVSMFRRVSGGTMASSIDAVMNEVTEMAKLMVAVIHNIVHEIFRRNGYFDSGVDLEVVAVTRPADIDSQVWPFYVTKREFGGAT